MVIEGCMHVVVCSAFLSPLFALANGFHFIAIRLHECHYLFCLTVPPFQFANGFRFTAIPFIFDCMSSNICSCA